jgi:hypothetical protein
MRRLLAGVVALSLLATPLYAQSGASVRQSGASVTPGTVPYWVTNGVIGDSVSAADSPVTSLGVTNNGGAGFCVSSDRITASGRNQLCFGAQTSGPATISLQNYGTASAQGLNFVINGTTVALPTGGGTFIFGNGPFTPGDVACFLNTGGVVQDCGLNLSTNGTILAGTWQGSTIGVAFGGTGATTATVARTNLGLGSIATQNANAVAITGGTVTGMPSPTNATDVATKTYVDSTAQGLNILAQSRLATAAVLPNTPTYANGSSGVGATLTSATNTTLTVDGTSTALNDVILVKNQAAPAQNGIYTQTQIGTGSVPWILTRATYFDQAAEMLKGSYTFVTAGSTNVNSSWVLAASITTVGTDAVNFNQFATSAAGVVSLGGLNGAIGLGQGLATSGSNVQTAAGVDTNTLNTQVVDYTIATTDCGATVQVGTGSTGQKTITLPSVSGFDSKCVVTIINGDTARGKKLVGFPSTNFTSPNILWPGQGVKVEIINGAWAVPFDPGRWKNPGTQTLHVDINSGSDANDCLATGAGACQNPEAAWTRAQYYWDTAATTPIIALACSQTHTGQLNMGGTPLGTNLIQLSPDGNCGATWQNNGPCINVSDLSELDLNLNFYGSSGTISFKCNQSNVASTGNILLHNAVVLDTEGTPSWSPAGSNDNFLFCDGPCEFTIANGVTQITGAGGNYVIYMSEGGKGTQSGVISATAAGGATGVYFLFGPSMLILGTSNGGGWSSIGTSKVYGGATLVQNGVTISGTATRGSGTGRICTTLTDSTC